MTVFYDYVSLSNEAEKKEENRVGNSRGGQHVFCQPEVSDPGIVEQRSRVVCLVKPFLACGYCPHADFALVFKVDERKERTEQVACPRWADITKRCLGEPPDNYVPTELATCSTGPFDYCTTCPSKRNVARVGADKSLPGWYGRWRRLTKEEDYEDADGGTGQDSLDVQRDGASTVSQEIKLWPTS